MNDDYFIIDVETCPLELKGYFELPEDEKKKFMNPIDSRIVALGIRHNGKNRIFMNEDEKRMLEDFWAEWKSVQKSEKAVSVVGFNIIDFDLPFITTRSFIHNVVISPFLLKQVIDLRQKLSAYKFGRVRGKLKELASLIGLSILEEGGDHVAKWYSEKKFDRIREYLERDLEITDEIYKRARSTKVLYIDRW